MLYRLSFRRRIWIAFMLIVIFAVTTVGALSYVIAEEVVKDNAYQLSQDTIDKTSKVLDEKLNHITQAVYSMMVNTAYRRALGLDSSYSDSENYYTHLSGLQSTFVQTKLTEPLIDSILIATREGDYYQTSQQRNFSHSFYDSALYTYIKIERRKLWVAGHEDLFFASREEVISFVMEGIPSHYIDDSYVVANVKIDSIRSFIVSEDTNRKPFLLLASSDGSDVLIEDSVITDKLKQDPKYMDALTDEQGSFEYSDQGDEYLVNFTRLGGVKEWTLFSFLPKAELMKQMDSIKLTILGVITGCLLVSFAFANMLTRLLVRPLSHLQTLMKRVEMNDLNVRYESEYNDEITQVGYRFNRMLEELNHMFDVVKQAETDKRQSEMKALQAQIDPHFLYNTLNTVYWKSQLNQLEDVQEMVLSLSQLFQLGLNRGKEMTSIEHELLHVEEYLKIQQKCYETLFTYSIEVDPLVDMQQPILKIMLQPLVENSILHGFNDRNEGGIIRIQVKQDDTQLSFIVEDNGLGFSENSAADPELRHPAAIASSGYALHNVRLRLQLQYGSTAGLHMESEPNLCTRVSIIIPRLPLPEGS
ncbi:histidine kinase [Paenibacillus sp. AK002]